MHQVKRRQDEEGAKHVRIAEGAGNTALVHREKRAKAGDILPADDAGH